MSEVTDKERYLLYTGLACLEREIQKQHKGLSGTTDPMLIKYMQDIVDGCEFTKKKICELLEK